MKKAFVAMSFGLMMVCASAQADAIGDAYESSQAYYHELYLKGLNEHDKKIWSELDMVTIEVPERHQHNTNYMGTVEPDNEPSTVMPEAPLETIRQ